jgi:tRNA-specific 2-thiouridylase
VAVSKRVVVAMSGGVDSSVAAALLVRQGYEVIGLMMRLWAEGGGANGGAHNRCCSPDAMAQARRVAEGLDIPFYVVDAQAPFKAHVVDFFVEGYTAGVTPNPCLECNRHIRWDFLLRQALALEADHLATGHYARVRQADGEWHLLKGRDERKDQSYVLSVMGQVELSRALFPVGELTKFEVRALARELGLAVAERPESQDLCFLADGSYRRFIAERAPETVQPGPIVNRAGEVLGAHHGLPFYTIGQRKGIGVAGPEALYVLDTDATRNALIVGHRGDLGSDRLTARRVNWVAGAPPEGPFRAAVKIRYKAAEAAAAVTPIGEHEAEVAFDRDLRDITPGQAAVFYDGEVCLGGGIIQRAETR